MFTLTPMETVAISGPTPNTTNATVGTSPTKDMNKQYTLAQREIKCTSKL